MTDGRVSSVNYVGDTGGPITQGEQCARRTNASIW
jgi:hypothetical protein